MSTLRCLHPVGRVISFPIRCVYSAPAPPAAQFHNSAALKARNKPQTRDKNRNRGVSAIHRRYPKDPLSVSKVPLPEPEAAEEKRAETVDVDHGLYGFFRDGKVLPTPEEDYRHGRAWSVEELRRKSWDDLHKLWWRCVKERNIIFTQALERQRLDPGYGEYEAKGRDREVNRTQRAIKHVLTERYYAWQEAVELAKSDPTVTLSGAIPAYNPMALEDPDPPSAPSRKILKTQLPKNRMEKQKVA